MRVEVKTGKEELLKDMEEVRGLLYQATKLLSRLPSKIALEVCSNETTDAAQDTQ